VRIKVPELGPELARQAVELVHRLRQLDLKKHPSISETLDWARALVTLNASSLERETLDNTMTVLLKHEADVVRARHALGRRPDDGQGSAADRLDVSHPRWPYR
jgi:MoxR-like ATPase